MIIEMRKGANIEGHYSRGSTTCLLRLHLLYRGVHKMCEHVNTEQCLLP
jgi:hypothetical protein